MDSDHDKKRSYQFPIDEKPENRGKWEALRLGVWNPNTKEFMGRTSKSWAGLLFFYAVFYTALAALFAICLQCLLYTINDDAPKWQLEHSLIGANPGLGFRPISEQADKEGALIWFEASNETRTKYYTDRLDSFLEPYRNPEQLPGGVTNQMVCDYDRPPVADKVCTVSTNEWGNCTSEQGYGYNRSAPCVFIKLNRIFGWVPDYYNDTNELPEDMPESLKEVIRKTEPKMRNTIWVSCEGEKPADVEHLGPVEYYPYQGIPGYYYPYMNTNGYLSPLVAVKFVRPELHVLINIECRAWAKNIRYLSYKEEREGAVHLEIMVD